MTPASGSPPARSKRASLLALALFLVLTFAVSAIGGLVTSSEIGSWYAGLTKPSFNPPDWVFAPVWTLLYLTMAVAAWLVWREAGLRGGRAALGMWAMQLALNLAWSILFFGLHLVGAAFAEILVLLAAILATTVLFWRHSALAGALMVPYAAWVAFAALLNFSILRLN